MRKLILLLGLLVGGSVGYVLGSLYAPEPGNAYRQRLVGGADRLRERLIERLEAREQPEIPLQS